MPYHSLQDGANVGLAESEAMVSSTSLHISFETLEPFLMSLVPKAKSLALMGENPLVIFPQKVERKAIKGRAVLHR